MTPGIEDKKEGKRGIAWLKCATAECACIKDKGAEPDQRFLCSILQSRDEVEQGSGHVTTVGFG